MFTEPKRTERTGSDRISVGLRNSLLDLGEIVGVSEKLGYVKSDGSTEITFINMGEMCYHVVRD